MSTFGLMFLEISLIFLKDFLKKPKVYKLPEEPLTWPPVSFSPSSYLAEMFKEPLKSHIDIILHYYTVTNSYILYGIMLTDSPGKWTLQNDVFLIILKMHLLHAPSSPISTSPLWSQRQLTIGFWSLELILEHAFYLGVLGHVVVYHTFPTTNEKN